MLGWFKLGLFTSHFLSCFIGCEIDVSLLSLPKQAETTIKTASNIFQRGGGVEDGKFESSEVARKKSREAGEASDRTVELIYQFIHLFNIIT